MHRVFATLLLSTLTAAQAGSAPPAQAAPPATAPPVNSSDLDNAQKARKLIDGAVQALGGQSYLTAQNRAEEGRWYHLHHGSSGGSAGVQYRMFSRYPDQDRLEIYGRSNVFIPLPLFDSVGVIVVSKKAGKNDIVVIHNGDKGYETTNKGTSAQDSDDLKAYLRRRQHSLEQVLRKWINDPTMQYFSDGLAIVDGKPTDQVTLLNAQNDAVTVYLDQNTHLPLKTSFTWRDPEDKQKNVEEEIYDNYRLVQGIMTPFSVTRTFNGETSHQRFINTAKYNLTLPDSMFEATVDYNPMLPPKKR
jgi:hypothetical protein